MNLSATSCIIYSSSDFTRIDLNLFMWQELLWNTLPSFIWRKGCLIEWAGTIWVSVIVIRVSFAYVIGISVTCVRRYPTGDNGPAVYHHPHPTPFSLYFVTQCLFDTENYFMNWSYLLFNIIYDYMFISYVRTHDIQCIYDYLRLPK